MNKRFDCVYYWCGGRVTGRWRQCMPEEGIAGGIARLNRMGYVALPGATSIGAPEGPPAERFFVEVGM